jgi:hypothetical protein
VRLSRRATKTIAPPQMACERCGAPIADDAGGTRFSFCESCGLFTCDRCWSATRGTCTVCARPAGADPQRIASAPVRAEPGKPGASTWSALPVGPDAPPRLLQVTGRAARRYVGRAPGDTVAGGQPPSSPAQPGTAPAAEPRPTAAAIRDTFAVPAFGSPLPRGSALPRHRRLPSRPAVHARPGSFPAPSRQRSAIGDVLALGLADLPVRFAQALFLAVLAMVVTAALIVSPADMPAPTPAVMPTVPAAP